MEKVEELKDTKNEKEQPKEDDQPEEKDKNEYIWIRMNISE